MFSVIISEKGGAERRESFDQTEVSIGRVKGNDVLLPKGNVSKRHARLIIRDQRFIVTDLKSTNGTYVNHRRITHATLVREGDRIYIGDFVLRIESDKPMDSSAPPLSPPNFEPESTSATSSSGLEPRPSQVGTSAIHLESTLGSASPEEVVSHFPIEHDPDESLPHNIELPAPPPVPTGIRPALTNDFLDTGSNPEAHTGSIPSVSPEPSSRTSSQPRIDKVKLAAWQEVLNTLIRAAMDQLDGEQLDAVVDPSAELVAQVSTEIERQLDKLRGQGDIPEDLDEGILREAAGRELLQLGPLTELLEDEAVSQIQIILKEISIVRRGRKMLYPSLGFSSERAIGRALHRMCVQSGHQELDDQQYVECLLPANNQLFAVKPPASQLGHMLIIKKLRRDKITLDALVRSGTISRSMASLLALCVTGRANILVAGGVSAGTESLVHALLESATSKSRAIWLSDTTTDGGSSDVPTIHLGGSMEERILAIRAASQLQPDHLIIPPLSGESLAAVLDSVTQGTEGVMMFTYANTLRQALNRLAANVASLRPEMSTETGREWLGSTFDIGLEIARLRDNRLRVVRLSEFRAGRQGMTLRDVFTFAYHRTAAGGSIEGSFYASGTVPRIVEDLAARGLPLDTSIFRRHPSG